MNTSAMSRRAIRRELRRRDIPQMRRDQLWREQGYRLHFRAPWCFPRMPAHMLTDWEIDREQRDPRTSVERREKLAGEWESRRIMRKGMAPDRI
jgi:hypothetical protein